MFMAISHKTKPYVFMLLKTGLIIATFYFIYTKLFLNETFHFNDFTANLVKFSLFSSNSVVFLVFLSILNWLFEILKWKTLTNNLTKTTFNEAAIQTLGAHTASLLTPNRIGDYGAKALYYSPPYQKKILWLNLLGNSAQMAITTIIGTLGLTYFVLYFQPDLSFNGIYIWLGSLALISLFTLGIINTNWFKNQALYKRFRLFKIITKTTLLKICLFSFIRYITFSFQFYYLLRLFEVNIDYFEAMAIISSMYLLASSIPSIFMFDVVVKSGIAIYLFGFIGVQETVILSISTVMWLLNFIIPSVIGCYPILHFKLPKTLS